MSHKNKYILGIVAIVCLLILGVGIFFSFKKSAKETYKTITSTDGKFTLSIRSDLDYKVNTKQDNTFTLDFYSVKNEMYCYASTIQKQREVDLLEVITDDKVSYLTDKQNVRDDSGIQPISIKDYTGYEYTLTYYDTSYGKDFYANIVWIETEQSLYCLNFEVIAENAEQNKDIFSKIKNSFVEV